MIKDDLCCECLGKFANKKRIFPMDLMFEQLDSRASNYCQCAGASVAAIPSVELGLRDKYPSGINDLYKRYSNPTTYTSSAIRIALRHDLATWLRS